jgi:hypothetical protein
MGGAFGAAIIGSLITVQTTNRAVDALNGLSLSVPVRDQAIATMRDLGPNFPPAPNLSVADTAAIERILTDALATAARVGLLFAMGVVFIGALLSLLIPRVRPPAKSAVEQFIDGFEPFEPMDIDPARL